MASGRVLIFASLLFCLSCIMSITGQDLSKHLVIENVSKQGFTRGRKAIQSEGNSSIESSIEAALRPYVHNAGYQSRGVDGDTRWHGVRAMINVWTIPDVEPLSASGAYIAAINKQLGQEFIAAGVHVNPSLYNDYELHFFTHWTTTGDYTTGCFNTDCVGFVIANDSNLLPGQALATPLSTYGGEQRIITIRIKKDEDTGDWSLYREDKGGPIGGMTLLGWWPSSIFHYLSYYAEVVQWAGFVTYSYDEQAPPMGSGHFSNELERKAASFDDCFGFDETGHIYEGYYRPEIYQDRPDCYNASEWYVTEHEARQHFFYGGPEGCL